MVEAKGLEPSNLLTARYPGHWSKDVRQRPEG
jgi:hypothetical protein